MVEVRQMDARDEYNRLCDKYRGPFGPASHLPDFCSEEYRRDCARREELAEQLGLNAWQQTAAEAWQRQRCPPASHRRCVERALARGDAVPERVRAEYPDLGPPAEKIQQPRRRSTMRLVRKEFGIE